MNKQSEKEHIPEWVTILSVLTAVFAVYWSIYTYNNLLPLSQSNIIFSGSEMTINKGQCGLGSGETDCNILELNIKNIGKVAAEDIRILFYSVWMNEKDLLPIEVKEQLGDRALSEVVLNYEDIFYPERQFRHRLIQNLEPGVNEYFGHFKIPSGKQKVKVRVMDANVGGQKIGEHNFEVDLLGKNIVLVYLLGYNDLINGEEFRKIFLFHHNTASKEVNVLLDEDFNKIYSRLKAKLMQDISLEQNKIYKKDIEELLKFIKTKHNVE